MRNFHAVIGANYGDEGKGKEVDILCREAQGKTIVIRFNGGAQAAHTVEYKGESRMESHSFHHIGSGYFAAADTYLGKHFIVNPILFKEEYYSFGMYSPFFAMNTIYVEPTSFVVTPFDMTYNKALENARREERHGSCGHGIFQTIQRNQRGILLQVCHLHNARELEKRILEIWEYYKAETRKEDCILSPESKLMIRSTDFCQEVLEKIKVAAKFFIEKTTPAQSFRQSEYNNFIFEGAQGLRLDQNNTEDMPYLTPSNTGLENVVEWLKDKEIFGEVFADGFIVHYVTRSYFTRHGAGPFEESANLTKDFDLFDRTNVENQFQGPLRYGYINLQDFVRHIVKDLEKAKAEGFYPLARVTMNHLDQTRGIVHWIDKGQVFRAHYPAFFAELLNSGVFAGFDINDRYGRLRKPLFFDKKELLK